MRSLTLRLVALVALAGQLQWLPASVACEREHGSPVSHCDQNASSPLVAVVDAETINGAPCALVSPCTVAAQAALAAASPRLFSEAVTRGEARSAHLSLSSRDLAPTPPPPLA
jgi:hypothetical protein